MSNSRTTTRAFPKMTRHQALPLQTLGLLLLLQQPNLQFVHVRVRYHPNSTNQIQYQHLQSSLRPLLKLRTLPNSKRRLTRSVVERVSALRHHRCDVCFVADQQKSPTRKDPEASLSHHRHRHHQPIKYPSNQSGVEGRGAYHCHRAEVLNSQRPSLWHKRKTRQELRLQPMRAGITLQRHHHIRKHQTQSTRATIERLKPKPATMMATTTTTTTTTPMLKSPSSLLLRVVHYVHESGVWIVKTR
jgi:hypothetical protein